MLKYSWKISIAIIVVAIFSIIIGAITQHGAAIILAGLCGASVLLYQHIFRCRSCQSWRTFRTEHWIPDDTMSDIGTVYVELHCGRCEANELLYTYRESVSARQRQTMTDY